MKHLRAVSRPLSLLLSLTTLLSVPLAARPQSASVSGTRIAPRVLVITTFEIGQDTGDTPGELQLWAERQHLDQSIAVPGLDHPLLTNGKGLYAMVCGILTRSEVQIMALATDPRVDLTHTYFLLSGIAGADPATATLADAVWIRDVVDGDYAFEIDSREIPSSWPYGTVAHGVSEPNQVPAEAAPMAGVSGKSSGGFGPVVLPLNPHLVDWAFHLTEKVTIPDTQAMSASRARFKSYTAADGRPVVLEGDSLGTNHFWHGAIMNQWARDWVRNYTRGAGTFVISDTEDQAVVIAIGELGKLHRADAGRLLILRTASNFTIPPPGVTPEKSLFEKLAVNPGYLPSLEANYQVGSIVVDALLKGWDQYQGRIP